VPLHYCPPTETLMRDATDAWSQEVPGIRSLAPAVFILHILECTVQSYLK
jgi:hypothetical protein